MCKWKILKPKEAKKYGITSLTMDDGGVFLKIAFSNIPEGMDVKDWLKFIVDKGIVERVE